MTERKTNQKEKREYTQKELQRFRTKAALIFLAILIVHFGVIFYYALKERKMLQNPIIQSEQNIIRVAGLEEQTDQAATFDIEQDSSSNEPILESNEDEEKLEEVLQLIFEEKGSMVGKGQVKISGLSANTKESLSFREADFQAALTSFLQKQNIKTSSVTIEKEVMTSEKNIVGYQLSVSGKEEIELLAYFFPKLPGQFFFTVLEKQEKQEIVSQPQTQIVQTEAAATQLRTEANDRYDASTLTISEIPEKLLNYLDNRYKLQYSLYDYLYKNGYRIVKNVTVEDYTIDAENQIAEIRIRLEGGELLTGRYEKVNNRYSFYE